MRRLICVALSAWGLLACGPMAYMPNQLQTPMLREAGEIQATLGNSNLTAAVSVAPGALLHAGGHYQAVDFDGPLDGPEGRAYQWLAEGGAGLFGDLGYKDFRWTVLFGGGAGSSWSSETDRSYDGRFIRGYVQPNVGWVTPVFEIIASARFSGVKFQEFSSSGYSDSWGLSREHMTTPVWFFVEPSLTVKAGYRWIKVFAQPTLSMPIAQAEVSHLPLNVVVGLSLDFAQWHGDWSF